MSEARKSQTQVKVAATYMRGGTSKGVFFKLSDLPSALQAPGEKRDRFLQRVIGSPDPYGQHIDGMGGATSSTSKTVIVAKSQRAGHDVDYLFGQVAIGQAFVDWSGNCGNLSAAVGGFAIRAGLLDPAKIPRNGLATVRIWQANISKTIVAEIPIEEGAVQECGDFVLDGVTFPAAEIKLTFCQPAEAGAALFPTGRLVDRLEVPGVGSFEATFIDSGIPTVFLNAADLGYCGTELQADINSDPAALARFETLRAHAAVAMGLIEDVTQAAQRQHTPKLAFVAPAADYRSASGKWIAAQDIHLLVRALSMGKLHHAMMGTAAVAIGTAAAIPGTLVNRAANLGEGDTLRFGHPSGVLQVGAKTRCQNGAWQVESVSMSRSARVLMEGHIFVPQEFI